MAEVLTAGEWCWTGRQPSCQAVRIGLEERAGPAGAGDWEVWNCITWGATSLVPKMLQGWLHSGLKSTTPWVTLLMSLMFNDGLHSLRLSALLKLAAVLCEGKSPVFSAEVNHSQTREGCCSQPLIEFCGVLNDDAWVSSPHQEWGIITQKDKQDKNEN